ncbi:cobalamin B12-binding domain-containing protein [Tautonia sociabilis]|uniref:Cobalamin B12-binding domain-containing protein n=1 Tax=Tautonia sociabilis TaxID=2080755 RepID=A0A432MLZ1_9BACT|nr:cobalamin B12-binding domain-containing protein [Tautonia sociabilis]RUL88422.1 cobalamin B12-binding domain-containing protein [Tautonia sociabilis]
MNAAADPSPFFAYDRRLVQLDRLGAVELVDRFLEGSGHDVAALDSDVFVPALELTGQQWEEGRITVAHEHSISEVTRDLILRHGPRLWAAPEAITGTAVSCCAPNERHVLALMMGSDLLRAAGLQVHLLGEGAPADSVRDFIEQVGADVLALSVSLPEHRDDARSLIALARSSRPWLLVLAGGRGLNGLSDPASHVGADFASNDLRTLHRILPGLLASHSSLRRSDQPS